MLGLHSRKLRCCDITQRWTRIAVMAVLSASTAERVEACSFPRRLLAIWSGAHLQADGASAGKAMSIASFSDLMSRDESADAADDGARSPRDPLRRAADELLQVCGGSVRRLAIPSVPKTPMHLKPIVITC